jgi:hypothetical protein
MSFANPASATEESGPWVVEIQYNPQSTYGMTARFLRFRLFGRLSSR